MEKGVQSNAKAPISVELECLVCRARARVDLSGEMFKELSEFWQIGRACAACGKRTEWSFAEVSVEDEEQVSFWDWLATTGEFFEAHKPASHQEKRQEHRVELRIPLRLAAADGRVENVTSENISKSGLCFTSSRSYRTGDILQVTLEPPGAAASQTMAATIVRVAIGDGRTLYGARIQT